MKLNKLRRLTEANISGSRQSIQSNILIYSRPSRKNLLYLTTNQALISASAVPHCTQTTELEIRIQILESIEPAVHLCSLIWGLLCPPSFSVLVFLFINERNDI